MTENGSTLQVQLVCIQGSLCVYRAAKCCCSASLSRIRPSNQPALPTQPICSQRHKQMSTSQAQAIPLEMPRKIFPDTASRMLQRSVKAAKHSGHAVHPTRPCGALRTGQYCTRARESEGPDIMLGFVRQRR
ncbi:hypothetical protein ABBQ38_010731 [Trebouxia sp. C0009 RCD-2024]